MSQQMSAPFFFTRLNEAWCIGGESGAAQKIVKVAKRNGEVRKVKLGNELGKGWNDCTVYQLKEDITDSIPDAIWTKYDGQWCVKTKSGLGFDTEITVVKRNGEEQTVILEKEIADGIYEAHSDKIEIIPGGCWECGNQYRFVRSGQCTVCEEEEHF